MPNEPASPPRPPRLPRRARRWACSPRSWTATASSSRPPRPATRPWPTPTTWPSCTRSGPPRPPRPASSATATCSRPPCRPATAPNPATRPGGCGGPCAPPNWPAWTPPSVLADAIAERDLAGARDIPAVIDARLRHRLGSLVPLPAGPWSAQVPAIADPERRAYVTEIAALMDARKDRIGEHAAEHALPWAVNALGPVPGHPLDRLDWQQRAASIGAYRELSGYDHPADPIGPEPAAAAPDLRAAWHEALAALGPVDGPDVRGMPDGTLLHLRDTYPVETAWAPQWVGDELRQVRAGARDARLAAPARRRRGRSRRAAAATTRQAARQQALAASYQALHEAYRQRETVFAAVMADRADWEAATRAQRHLAVAADAELRRRHPGQQFTPLRSAEPAARHRRPARRAHPDRGTGHPRDGPVDQGPGRRAPDVRRQARRPAEPDDPLRRPRLRRPRPGVPGLDRTRPGTRSCSRPSPRSAPRRGSWSASWTATPTWKPQIDSSPVHPGSGEVTAMAAIGITGMGLTGVLRMTWVQDDLAHVLEHSQTDETSGTWTGLACPDHGLALGGDVDDATLRRLAGQGEIADLTWEAPDDITAEHGQVFQAAIAAYQAAEPGRAEELWEKVRAVWSRAWSANYAALEFLQDTGPEQVLAGQAAAMGGRLLRAPHRPARPAAPPHPQHRHRRPDQGGVAAGSGRAGAAACSCRRNCLRWFPSAREWSNRGAESADPVR